MGTSEPDNDSKAQLDNARVGYQVAATLMTYEGNLIWTRFSAMLVAHTIILGAVGLSISAPAPFRQIAQGGLPMVGLVLCGVWLVLNRRGFDYYAYWILSMRELEEAYLAPAVKTVSRGAAFAANKKVSLSIDGLEKIHQTKRLGRYDVASMTKVVIGVFALLYVSFVVMSILDLV